MIGAGFASDRRSDCTMPCRPTSMVPWDHAAQGAPARLKRASFVAAACLNGISLALPNSWPSRIPAQIGDDTDFPSIFLHQVISMQLVSGDLNPYSGDIVSGTG